MTSGPETVGKAKVKQGKVSTTITLPKELAAEILEAANRAGIGWTQMMAVLLRQALDAQKARG